VPEPVSPAIAAVAAVMDEIDQCRNPMPCELCRQRMQSVLDMGAAAERERSEALIVQAQDYARAESERAGKLAALALRALNQCHALERDDSAPYLDEWSMALEQLEGAAGEMSPPDGDPLDGAYQAGIKAERQRCVSLAESVGATYRREHIHREMDGPERLHSHQAPFAGLIREVPGDRPAS
jgi:hypothetical protein